MTLVCIPLPKKRTRGEEDTGVQSRCLSHQPLLNIHLKVHKDRTGWWIRHNGADRPGRPFFSTLLLGYSVFLDTHAHTPTLAAVVRLPVFFQYTFSRRFSSPCFGSAEQGWQADSFAFRCIKATFPPWQPVLFCHLIARASHFSGQPLLLDRPLSLPIILSVYSALPPPRHAAPLSYQCNYFFWQAIHQP